MRERASHGLHGEFDVLGDGACVPVARRAARRLDRGNDGVDELLDVPRLLDPVPNVFQRGSHGAAALVPEHDDELGLQRLDGELDRAESVCVQEISGDAHDE